MKNIRLDALIATIAATQFGTFSRVQAIEVGASREAIRWRLSTGQWERLSRDVFRIAGLPDTWHSRLWAAVLEAGPSAVVSHRAAAALVGLPGFGPGPVEVTRREGGNHRLTLGRLHQTFWLPPDHTRLLQGVPSTSLARTLCDLAGDEHPARVKRAVQTSLRRFGLALPNLITVHASLARRGRAGTVLMRDIIEEIDSVGGLTESELEDLFVEVLRSRGVEAPERQVNLGNETRFIGRVDFFDRRANLPIEVHGHAYHDTLLEIEADALRVSELAASGRRVMVVTYRQLVDDPDGVVDRLERARAAVLV